MPYFKTKLFTFFASISVIIACFLFLTTVSIDNLAQFAPDQAEFYIHTTKKHFSELSYDKKQLFLQYLEQKSTFSSQDWENIINNVQKDIAFFSINNQIFGLTKNSPNFNAFITESNISASKFNNFIIFPEFEHSEQYLIDQNWFKNLYKKVYFAKFSFYSQKQPFFNQSFLKNINKEPISAFGYYQSENPKLEVNILGKVGQNPIQIHDFKYNQLPENTDFYIRGLKTDQIIQNLEYEPDNFIYFLLKNSNGPVEFIKTNNNFTLILQKSSNSLEQIQKAVLNTLAHYLPSKQIKYLPDQSKSIQLIADPSQWQFTQNNDLLELYESELDLNLFIKQSENQFIISNSVDFIDSNNLADEKIDLSQKFGSCKNSNQNQFIFLNNQNQLFKSTFSKILIFNHNPNKISICID